MVDFEQAMEEVCDIFKVSSLYSRAGSGRPYVYFSKASQEVISQSNTENMTLWQASYNSQSVHGPRRNMWPEHDWSMAFHRCLFPDF